MPVGSTRRPHATRPGWPDRSRGRRRTSRPPSARPRVAGAANSAANASGPIVPRPIASCRSRFEPAASRLSLTWTSPMRPRPAARAYARSAAANPSVEERSCPAACMWHVSRQTPMRSSRPSTSRYAPSDAADEANAPPPPAVGLDQQARCGRERVEHREHGRAHLRHGLVPPAAQHGRSGMHDDAARPDRRGTSQRERERGRRSQPGVGRGRAEVDQVGRVDEHRQPALGTGSGERVVTGRVGGRRCPAARVRDEDLHRLGIELVGPHQGA